MTLKRLLPAVLALVAVHLLVPEIQAAPRGYGARPFREAYELNAYLTFTDFGSRMELDDDGGAGFRFGYLYNPHHEIEFMYNSVTADDTFFPGETADIDHLQVAYVLNLTEKSVVPYLTAGLGLVHTNDSSPFLGSETNPVLGMGGGVRFFVGARGVRPLRAAGQLLRGGRRRLRAGRGLLLQEVRLRSRLALPDPLTAARERPPGRGWPLLS